MMGRILIKNIDNNMVEKYGERLKKKRKKNRKGKNIKEKMDRKNIKRKG